ncbi:MAG: phosphoribosyltransferase [Patescibacteria group bacterium]
MDRPELWKALEDVGVVRYDRHIILRSGLHTRAYANFVPSRVPYHLREELISHLEESLPRLPQTAIDDLVIIGTGCGEWYASIVAYRLQAEYMYAEKETSGRYIFRRDQAEQLPGKHVILLDDVLCTGRSAFGIVKLVLQVGGTMDGVMFILDRHASKSLLLSFQHGYVLRPTILFHAPMETWARDACPMCASGIPYSIEHGAGNDEFHQHGQPQMKL